MRKQVSTAFLVLGAACMAAVTAPAQSSRLPESAPKVYIAHLQPVNSKVTGEHTSGIARLTVRGDSLTISIDVRNAPANTAHLQHFHGLTNGSNATCATQDADANNDKVVDLMETEPMSGTTMVPFTDDPVSMEVVTDAYPKADAKGSYRYSKTVSLSALEKAFSEKFSGQQLDLDHRGTKLPSTAASLGTIPAQVTLPIACGKIEAVNR